jgi:C1A family cysteine protease
MMAQRHSYGWVPSRPDQRDFKFSPPRRVLEAMPPSGDLRGGMGPVLDQSRIGSCGPNSADSLVMFDQQKQGIPVGSYSRLLVYYFTRKMMGTVGQDSGVDNRTMLKALNQYGFCPEALWPYDVSRFTESPPQAAQSAAKANAIQSYAAVPQDPTSMKGCLAAGLPFLFGFTVYESFESDETARTGVVPMPSRSERVLGGHDVCICGYDDATQRFRFKNSWGESWGDGGYGFFPYAYALDPGLSGDFWVINAVPGGGGGDGPGPGPVTVGKLDFRKRGVKKGTPVYFVAKQDIPAAIIGLVVEPGTASEAEETESVEVEALP